MLHPCPSCGTKLKVSSEEALSRAKCPRCGTSLADDGDEAAPGGRKTIVLVVFAACLLIPLAVALPLLLSNSGEPENPTPPQQQVAQGGTTPGHGLPVEPLPAGHGQPGGKGHNAGDLVPVDNKHTTTPPSGHLPDRPTVVTPPPVTPPREEKQPEVKPVLPVVPPPEKSNPVTVPAEKPPLPEVPVKPVAPPKAKEKGQQVMFMGAVGTGRRFCIIADNSGSMRGTPIEVLKYELGRTLQSIRADSEFYVIFFNSKAVPQPTPGWLKGVSGVPQVWPWIQSIEAGGTTKPQVGFEVAFQLNPRPDAIFFMTDGAIPPDVPQVVLGMNDKAPRIPIHTILFSKINPKASPQSVARVVEPMRVIAFQSGGTFSAVPVPQAPPKAPQPPRPPKK